MLDDWTTARTRFVKVFPNDYKRALGEIHDRKALAAASGNDAKAGMATATPAAAPARKPAAV